MTNTNCPTKTKVLFSWCQSLVYHGWFFSHSWPQIRHTVGILESSLSSETSQEGLHCLHCSQHSYLPGPPRTALWALNTQMSFLDSYFLNSIPHWIWSVCTALFQYCRYRYTRVITVGAENLYTGLYSHVAGTWGAELSLQGRVIFLAHLQGDLTYVEFQPCLPFYLPQPRSTATRQRAPHQPLSGQGDIVPWTS